MKSKLQYTTGILIAFCLMIILLFTSVQAVVYWTPGYFEKEYSKYGVDKTVNMTMEDLLDVTDQMMAYLRGDREDLHVPTIVGGQQREFFNEREIAHMEDVRGLFLAALSLRSACVLLIALGIIILLLLKTPIKRVLPRALCAGTLLFFLITAILAAIISTDFNRYFIMFHHIFFSNDLWILNPETDLLINIVPEEFFSDTTLRIGLTFVGGIVIVLASSLFLIFTARSHHKEH